MPILRRSTSMVSAEAWAEMDKQAKSVLGESLSARKVVDFVGPKGWDYAAHPIGRLNVDFSQSGAVKYGIHEVLPMVESRSSFELDIWELDNITRGCKNPDLSALDEAAREIARFEDNMIYNGFAPASVTGLSRSASENALKMDCGSDEGMLKAVASALTKFRCSSIEGPYTLLADKALLDAIYTRSECYPLSDKIKKMTGGEIVRSNIEGACFLISSRGGDFELVVGQDISLGYEGRSDSKLKFFFAETLTFNTLTPEAVVPLLR